MRPHELLVATVIAAIVVFRWRTWLLGSPGMSAAPSGMWLAKPGEEIHTERERIVCQIKTLERALQDDQLTDRQRARVTEVLGEFYVKLEETGEEHDS
jgi:hypothetical protein